MGDTAMLVAGTYTVFVTDANGCTTLQTVTLQEKLLVTTTINNHPGCSSCIDGSISTTVTGTGKEPYTYRWEDDNGKTVATTATADSLPPGTYVLTVTDSSGCYITQTINLWATDIASNYTAANLKLYPNPSSGIVFIETDPDTELVVTNLQGQLVFSHKGENNNVVKLDLSNQAKGIYFLTAIHKQTKLTTKIVLQ
jgi:hypothetical protein